MKVRTLKQNLFLLITHSLILPAILFLNSCDVINPAEPVPTYIQLDSTSLITNYVDEGSNLSSFVDAWIYVDGNYLGTYEYPFTVPVIGEGQHKISVRAGILKNGISGSRAAYPKTSTFDTLFSLQPNQTNIIKPTVKYLDGIVFAQMEDFDDGSLTLVPTGSNAATLNITSANDPNALEGNSGHITLDSSHPDFEFASSSAFYLPITTESYVELNYKCTQEFSLGVFVTTISGVVQTSVLNLRPTSTWKKVYVNLNEGEAIFNNALEYKIYLKSSLVSGSATADIYLDNLKVLY